MLSKADKDWLNKLSSSEKIDILPHDPNAKNLFISQKKEIMSILGQTTVVLHVGASDMGISGQNEIDIVIPVAPDKFNGVVAKLKKVYGAPDSFYPRRRSRFNRYLKGKKMEIAVLNEDSNEWHTSMAFHNYIKTHPKSLEEYRKLKEMYSKTGKKDYYQRKMEFINSIIEQIVPDKTQGDGI